MNINSGNLNVDRKQLEYLAEQFGLPLILRKGVYTVIGEQDFVEFYEINEFYTTSGGNTMTEAIKSPVGEIVWMAVAKAKKDEKTGKEYYSARLAFDVKTDAEFLSKISAVNKAMVVTAQSYRGDSDSIKALLSKGKAIVGAKSLYQPLTFDKDGNEVEAPGFFAESTGTARMIVEPYTGSSKGGTVNLVGVQIETLNTPEGTGTADRETKLAEIRALAAKG